MVGSVAIVLTVRLGGSEVHPQLRIIRPAGWWWYTPLIPALRRQRQEDISEFEASLVYRVGSMTARTGS